MSKRKLDRSMSMVRWEKKPDDVDGPYWSADVHVGMTLFNLMVSEEDEGWGYTVADGGGATAVNREGFGTRREAMIDAANELAKALAAALREAEALKYAATCMKGGDRG